MTTPTPETPPTDEIPVQKPSKDTAGPGTPGSSTTAPSTTGPSSTAPSTPGPSTNGSVTKATRISGTWIAVIVATIILVFLLIFILANLTSVTVSFLGMSGELPLGVALLFAAISGALLVALVGAARILQLRHRVRRAAKTH